MKQTNDAKKGGMFVGKRHSEGGIQGITDEGKPIEVEGGEAILTVKAMQSKNKHQFDGKLLTPCEIANILNVKDGNGREIVCNANDLYREEKGMTKAVAAKGGIVNKIKENGEKEKKETIPNHYKEEKFDLLGHIFDITKAYNLISNDEIKAEIITVNPAKIDSKITYIDNKKVQSMNPDYSKPLGLMIKINGTKDINMLIDGNHRTRKAVIDNKKSVKYYYIKDPKDIKKFYWTASETKIYQDGGNLITDDNDKVEFITRTCEGFKLKDAEQPLTFYLPSQLKKTDVLFLSGRGYAYLKNFKENATNNDKFNVLVVTDLLLQLKNQLIDYIQKNVSANGEQEPNELCIGMIDIFMRMARQGFSAFMQKIYSADGQYSYLLLNVAIILINKIIRSRKIVVLDTLFAETDTTNTAEFLKKAADILDYDGSEYLQKESSNIEKIQNFLKKGNVHHNRVNQIANYINLILNKDSENENILKAIMFLSDTINKHSRKVLEMMAGFKLPPSIKKSQNFLLHYVGLPQIEQVYLTNKQIEDAVNYLGELQAQIQTYIPVIIIMGKDNIKKNGFGKLSADLQQHKSKNEKIYVNFADDNLPQYIARNSKNILTLVNYSLKSGYSEENISYQNITDILYYYKGGIHNFTGFKPYLNDSRVDRIMSKKDDTFIKEGITPYLKSLRFIAPYPFYRNTKGVTSLEFYDNYDNKEDYVIDFTYSFVNSPVLTDYVDFNVNELGNNEDKRNYLAAISIILQLAKQIKNEDVLCYLGEFVHYLIRAKIIDDTGINISFAKAKDILKYASIIIAKISKDDSFDLCHYKTSEVYKKQLEIDIFEKELINKTDDLTTKEVLETMLEYVTDEKEKEELREMLAAIEISNSYEQGGAVANSPKKPTNDYMYRGVGSLNELIHILRGGKSGGFWSNYEDYSYAGTAILIAKNQYPEYPISGEIPKSMYLRLNEIEKIFLKVEYNLYEIFPNNTLNDNIQNAELKKLINNIPNTINLLNWFGNSKIELNDIPLVVYHATPNDFDEFKETDDIGYHFGNKEQANRLATTISSASVMPVYLRIENPIYIEDIGYWYMPKAVIHHFAKRGYLSENDISIIKREKTAKDKLKKITEILLNKGFDGVIYKNHFEGDGLSYITFKSNQIKSATATNLFDNNSNKIIYDKGGNMDINSNIKIKLLIEKISNMVDGDPRSNELKESLKNDYGVDYDNINKDDYYLNNASLDSIKEETDFLSRNKYKEYAIKLVDLRENKYHISLFKLPKVGKTYIGEIRDFLDTAFPNRDVMLNQIDNLDTPRYNYTFKDIFYVHEISDKSTFIYLLGEYIYRTYGNSIHKAATITLAMNRYAASNEQHNVGINFMYYFLAPDLLKEVLPCVYAELNKFVAITANLKLLISDFIGGKSGSYQKGGIMKKEQKTITVYRGFNGNDPLRVNDNTAGNLKYGYGIYCLTTANRYEDYEHKAKIVLNYSNAKIYNAASIPNQEYINDCIQRAKGDCNKLNDIIFKNHDLIIIKNKKDMGDEVIFTDINLIENIEIIK